MKSRQSPHHSKYNQSIIAFVRAQLTTGHITPTELAERLLSWSGLYDQQKTVWFAVQYFINELAKSREVDKAFFQPYLTGLLSLYHVTCATQTNEYLAEPKNAGYTANFIFKLHRCFTPNSEVVFSATILGELLTMVCRHKTTEPLSLGNAILGVAELAQRGRLAGVLDAVKMNGFLKSSLAVVKTARAKDCRNVFYGVSQLAHYRYLSGVLDAQLVGKLLDEMMQREATPAYLGDAINGLSILLWSGLLSNHIEESVLTHLALVLDGVMTTLSAFARGEVMMSMSVVSCPASTVFAKPLMTIVTGFAESLPAQNFWFILYTLTRCVELNLVDTQQPAVKRLFQRCLMLAQEKFYVGEAWHLSPSDYDFLQMAMALYHGCWHEAFDAQPQREASMRLVQTRPQNPGSVAAVLEKLLASDKPSQTVLPEPILDTVQASTNATVSHARQSSLEAPSIVEALPCLVASPSPEPLFIPIQDISVVTQRKKKKKTKKKKSKKSMMIVTEQGREVADSSAPPQTRSPSLPMDRVAQVQDSTSVVQHAFFVPPKPKKPSRCCGEWLEALWLFRSK